MTKVQSYLRTYRKRSGLTQDEVAFLLGCRSGANIARFERLRRRPNLEIALACQVVFGILAHDLFPGVSAEVEKIVTERARQLSGRLRVKCRDDHSRLRQKLATLSAIIDEGDRVSAE